ncbi:MAG: LuxR C-terminal-related transcriptional regulator [Pseudomonadota bacterium]
MTAAPASVTWFAKSKTRAPKFSIPLVERLRLLAKLDAALDKPFSCIVAPAGFGKSTLLSQWRTTLIERDIPCAWINLDESEQEIRQFFAYLALAFEEAGVSLGALKVPAENGFVDMSLSTIAESLLAELRNVDGPMVLILDDYHRAASEQIDGFIADLSEQCGDRLHIAIGSREAVSINLPSLLAAGRAIEIPSLQLRFSDAEVVKAMDGEMDQASIDALQSQVEGWPVAVQMTRLLGQRGGSVSGSIAGISGSSGHIGDYLTKHVIENLPDDLRKFLLETSILKRFNEDLANTVRESDDSQTLMRELEPLQALIVPLDDDVRWFRYHHLFAECLSDLLRREDPKRYTELHRRAADWCSANRAVAEGVDYAIAIEDYALARRVINENAEWMRAVNFGGVGYLNGLLANIPESEIVKDPRTLYMKAYAYMLVGEFKKSLFYNNIAESLIERDGMTPELFRDQLGVGTGILSRVEFELEREGGWIKERLEQIDPFAEADPNAALLCGLIRTSLAVQKLGYGDFEDARDYATAAAADLEKADTPVTISYLHVSQGSIAFWSNAFEDARRHFQAAAEAATKFGGGDQSNMKFIGETLYRTIDYWQGGLDEDAPHDLEKALMPTLEADGWYDIYAIGFDAVVHDALCREDYERADALLDRLEQSTERLAIERLTQFSQLLRLDYHVACGFMGEAEILFNKIREWLLIYEQTAKEPGWFHLSLANYTCARYLSAAGRTGDALEHVERGLGEIEELDVVLLRVRGSVLKAAILDKTGRRDEAVSVLERIFPEAARIAAARPFAGDVPGALVSDAAAAVRNDDLAPATAGLIDTLTLSDTRALLSDRERDVLQAMVTGKSNKEVARDLGLTENTVKFHLRNIYGKLGVSKRVSAVARARELSLIK